MQKEEPSSDEGFEEPETAPQDHQSGQPAVELRQFGWGPLKPLICAGYLACRYSGMPGRLLSGLRYSQTLVEFNMSVDLQWHQFCVCEIKVITLARASSFSATG
eukprot:6048563-Amphidinium_carterae.1